MSLLMIAAVAAAVMIASGWTPPAIGAGTACVVQRQTEGRELLYNACGECRVATVERQRPGEGFPISRKYTIPGNSVTQMSFRGPGSTRITGDAACDTAARKDQSAASPKVAPASPSCTQMIRRGDGTLAAANSCQDCRSVTIERVDARGASTSEVYAIDARQSVPVDPMGAVRAKIIGETGCR